MVLRRNPDLEQAISAHPGDMHGFLVYADWLQEQGDPRGELIAVQHALRAAPDPTRKTREAALQILCCRKAAYAGGTLAAAFSPDGKRLVTAHSDGSLLVWALDELAARR